jgi:hypothetical protein
VTREKKTLHCSVLEIISGHFSFLKQKHYSIAIPSVSALCSEDVQFESLPEHEPS